LNPKPLRGLFGAKGGGELVCVPTPPALANAVFNAIGLRVDSLPITAEKIKPHCPETLSGTVLSREASLSNCSQSCDCSINHLQHSIYPDFPLAF
jgi:hypothetical protein